MKIIKEMLYHIKIFFKLLFYYPKKELSLETAQDNDLYWEEKRGDSMGSLSSWQQERADYILQSIKGKKDLHIADIGCADGSILKYLKRHHSSINKVTGYDNSEKALSIAKEAGVNTAAIDLLESKDLENLVEADYYLLLEVVEHVPNSEQLLMNALKMSKKGLFFSVPNTGFLRHRLRLLFGRFPLQWKVFPNEHLRFWTYKDLKWWLQALSLEKNAKIKPYKGIPILNKLFPSLFAAGLIIFIEHSESSQ